MEELGEEDQIAIIDALKKVTFYLLNIVRN